MLFEDERLESLPREGGCAAQSAQSRADDYGIPLVRRCFRPL